MRLSRCMAVVVAVGLAMLSARAADEKPTERVMLVHLRWASNEVSVVRAQWVPGRLKKKAFAEGTLQVRLADAQGQALWTSAIQDPRIVRYEFPDDSHPGALRQLDQVLPTADLVVRLPAQAGATEFQLLGAVPPASGALAAPAAVPAGGNSERPRPILLRLPLPGETRVSPATK